MKLEFEENPGITMERLAKEFKEDASQATARLAVATGKNLANKSQPWGLGRKAKDAIRENVERAAKRVCYIVKDTAFLTKLKRQGPRARLKYKAGFGGWNPVLPGQIQSDPAAINRQIDKVRAGKANPPRWIPWSDIIIVSKTAFARAMTLRRKRIGIHKGGWLGAGIQAAGLQGGPDRAKIGKNVASWAQKHRRMGAARYDGDRRFVTLTNYAVASEWLLTASDQQAAFEAAEENTISWYQKAIKRREREQR